MVYNSTIDAYAEFGKLEDANCLFKEMEEQGHSHDSVVISLVVKAFTQHGTC